MREKGIPQEDFKYLVDYHKGNEAAAKLDVMNLSPEQLKTKIAAMRGFSEHVGDESSGRSDSSSDSSSDWMSSFDDKVELYNGWSDASSANGTNLNDSDEALPMVYSQDYLDKLQANKKDDKENDIVSDIRDTLMSHTSYIYEESLNNLMEKVHNQNDFTLSKDNNKFLNIDYTTIPSSVLGQLGRVNEIVSFQIVDEAATGLYIIAELDGTFKDIQGNKSVLAENVANIGAHYYNKENNAENLKDIVTVIPMENTEFDQTFINDVNHMLMPGLSFLMWRMQKDCIGMK